MNMLSRSFGALRASSRVPLVTPRAQFSTTSAALANSLLFLEHKNGQINPSSLVAATAAGKLGGDVDGILVGDSDADKVADVATN